jgi:maltose alpha-D-glucosyltransferase/alpha-amylase
MDTPSPKTPGWLDEAILYQIYPQSFQDSNGDGIGDLAGLRNRLDYVKSLGVDAIWLNPIFDSPFMDAGYDVRDFYKVAERYGSNEELKKLIGEAHACGLRVLLDIVAGHTSIEHPWFQASARHEKNTYTDWFIWTDSVWNAHPPTGGKFLPGYGNRDGAFMSNFFWCQPALNYGFANPEAGWQQSADAPGPQAVRRELKKIMRHWLEMGCDGFRVDMAHSLVKGKGPARQKGLIDIWHDVRGWMEREFPDTILIAEWGYPKEAVECGFHIDFMLHTNSPGWNSLFRTREAVGVGRDPYGPSYFEKSGLGNIRRYYDFYLEHLSATEGRGFISVPSGNHDTPPRLGKGRDLEDMKVAFSFLLTQPGVPIIYYGDEIGMCGVDGLPSKEGSFNRTCVRTPMQWSANESNSGFSEASAENLYLPVGTDTASANVETQEKDPGSLLNFVRELIRLRKATPALGNKGGIELVHAPDGGIPLVYKRIHEGDTVYVALNPASRVAEAELPSGEFKGNALLGEQPVIKNDRLHMPPVSYRVFR